MSYLNFYETIIILYSIFTPSQKNDSNSIQNYDIIITLLEEGKYYYGKNRQYMNTEQNDCDNVIDIV